MKVLILPSYYITDYVSRNFRINIKYILQILSRFDFNYENAKQYFWSNEHYYFGHIPKIIGEKNTFIVGNYCNDYKINEIPFNTRFPSLHKTPKSTNISFKECLNRINEFEVIIIGARTGEFGKRLRTLSRKKDIFTVCLDYPDHPEVYREDLIENPNLITRGLKFKDDFDIYFKHDVPKNYESTYLYPLCPTPINFDNYPKLKFRSFNDKKISISFLGRMHSELQKERGVLVDYFKNSFKDTFFKGFESNDNKRTTLEFYSEVINKSKIVFSPSGKVWDSARHAEPALYNSIPLISKPNCKLANDINISEENSIFYELELNNNLKIKNTDYLADKISFILNNEQEYTKLSNAWLNEMKSKNTLEKRSEYIINIIKEKIK
tara:strand:+ start:128 stop:1267 length:1140 start_codon:yes stop_codon:yes gene_type:complete